MATCDANSWRAPPNRPSRSSVLARNAAAALALARAISGVTQRAPSIRWQATRWPPSSTTATATWKPSSRALAHPRSMHATDCARVSATSGPPGCTSHFRLPRVSGYLELRNSRSRPRVSGHVQPHVARLDPHGVTRHRVAASRHQTGPGADVELPAVPRARQPRAAEPSLAEWPPLVGAHLA